jgi:hypothetical protein
MRALFHNHRGTQSNRPNWMGFNQGPSVCAFFMQRDGAVLGIYLRVIALPIQPASGSSAADLRGLR